MVISIKRGSTITLVAAAWIVGWTGWALAHCCGDCDGDGVVAIDEVVSTVGNALNGCSEEGRKCPADSVKVGPLCVDKYEASVWQIPGSDTTLIRRVQNGQIATEDDLAGATRPHGPGTNVYGPGCPKNAAGCTDYYAVSIQGVQPGTRINWFQSDAICRNSGKRLLTNAEWQRAAYGTPSGTPQLDDGVTDCNIYQAGNVANTGSRSRCMSDVGVFDMVGNVGEWVADWLPASTECTGWGSFSDDIMCLGVGEDSAGGPVAPIRGGHYAAGQNAGVFDIESNNLSGYSPAAGFRCAREF